MPEKNDERVKWDATGRNFVEGGGDARGNEYVEGQGKNRRRNFWFWDGGPWFRWIVYLCNIGHGLCWEDGWFFPVLMGWLGILIAIKHFCSFVRKQIVKARIYPLPFFWTIRYASRKAYAEARPRIKVRFAKRTEVESEVDQIYSSAAAATAAFMESIQGYGVVPSF
ncbi:Zinc finger protein CONSTANS-LIKE 5 [Dendrobium catenatum]|uniref:Zinc finger protein CONSTANS-LIKE 5 n=1 Tax=Dendrobium catenatum TaxID=906689 RepID=A0A2I0W5S5_9ASPA|nr:Zinc finger protein CONSTANS-LIKE 5 [Dendrobium catenatum]